MEKNFNSKSLHSTTLFAIQNAKKNVGDSILKYIENEATSAATKKLAFQVEIDFSACMNNYLTSHDVVLSEEHQIDIEQRILNDLDIAKFEVIQEKDKGKKILKISWENNGNQLTLEK